MKKLKTYPQFDLSRESFQKLHQFFMERAASQQIQSIWEVSADDAMWTFDSFEEFLADYKPEGLFNYMTSVFNPPGVLTKQLMLTRKYQTVPLSISFSSGVRSEIQEGFNLIEAGLLLRPQGGRPLAPVRVFIGHGKSGQWRELKDHLQDQHGFPVESFETGARSGHTIRDILEQMLAATSIAFLVLTGEDEMGDGTLRARQNVVHETGLFQGRLGFSKAVVLLEGGAEEFSNLAGIQQIRYSAGNIRESFGDVVATIRREFGPGLNPAT